MNVLIVDDDDDMRELMRRMIDIAGRGLRVQGVATDGVEAVERWRCDRPDVIVMDHRMPNMTGMDAAKEILAEDPSAKIILVTVFGRQHLGDRAEKLGILGVVAKSEGFDRLVPALHALAERNS